MITMHVTLAIRPRRGPAMPLRGGHAAAMASSAHDQTRGD